MCKKSQLLDLLRTNQNCKKQVDFINHFSQSKKLLELGANSDKLLIDLSKQKFDVSAIPSSVERAIFSKRKSVKIKKGRLQHIYGKEKYDIITVFNFNLGFSKVFIWQGLVPLLIRALITASKDLSSFIN